jgi:phosphohistidine phosphatase
VNQTVYLVHHGEAVDSDVNAQRPLSHKGQKRVEHLADLTAAKQVKPDAIWHSGKLRTRQTAQAFWRACNPLSELSMVRGLQPTDPAEWILDRVNADTRSIMLVGHKPNLDWMLSLILNKPSTFPPHGIVGLGRGTATWVEIWRLSSP